MRENRTSGSEGGETGATGLSYPYREVSQSNVDEALASSAVMKGYHTTLRTAISILLLSLSLGLSSSGCRSFGPQQIAPPTRSDRLMQAYPELRGGRFAVIADFEDLAHMELVHIISVSPQAKGVLSLNQGRRETGTGCLRFTAGSPDDAILLNNDEATNWYLKRDWRPYDLLAMAIHSPLRDLKAEVTIATGTADSRLAVRSFLPLQRGWNILRLDLGEVGEYIPLDDVRGIRLSIAGADKPVDVCFDDIILTGSREDLFGCSQDRDGGLYVQRVGRRWNIGAGGRFELTFANGQIIGWYNLVNDPYRLRNLSRGTTLGPSPVLLDSPNGEAGDFTALGSAVVARPRIVEMNEVRAVVTCDWRFVDHPDAPLDARPFQRWVYTIYPTGQIYVAVECTAATRSWAAPGLGLAVTLASADEGTLQARATGASSEGDRPRDPVYALARSEFGDASLLYILAEPTASSRIIEQLDRQRRRASLVAVSEESGSDVRVWRCQLMVASGDDVSDEEARARAADYVHPAKLHFQLGSSVSPGGDVYDGTGFDPASGCYRILPDDGHARFVVGGRKHPRFSPAFEIIDTKRRDAWVYVNHLIFDKVARDASGNLIFQLPTAIRDDALVEVIFRRLEGLDTPAPGS